MHSTALELAQLGAMFFGLGLLGRLARRIGISPIPFYLLGGLALGTGGLVPLDEFSEFTSVSAEIGVVLLLLLLGLEYSPQELTTGLRRAAPAGVVDAVLNATPGAVVALLLGWRPPAVLAMAGVTWISSSGIVAKVLSDLRRLGNRETPVVLSVLVLEDLAMALYLPLLAAALAGVGLFSGLTAVAVAVGALVVVLVVALRYGRLVSAVVEAPDAETFLLRVLGVALIVAGIAATVEISAAVGAFLLGIAISGTTAATATRLLEPLRDLFAALFFVVFGSTIEPSRIPPVLGIAVLLALIGTVTKVATGWWAAAAQGIGTIGRARAGTVLIARGEFSIVIAGLTITSTQVNPQFGALATTYVLIMAVVGPIAARVAEPLARRLAPH